MDRSRDAPDKRELDLVLRAGVVPLLGPAVPLLEALPLVRLAAPSVAPLSACNELKFLK